MFGRKMKPKVKEISLAFKPKNRRKYLMLKEENIMFTNLIKILEDAEPLLKEDLVNSFMESQKLTDDAKEAIKGVLRILNAHRDDLPKGILSSLSKAVPEYGTYASPEKTPEEKKKEDEKRLAELKKKCEEDAKMKKGLEDHSEEYNLLKDTVDQMAKDLANTREELSEARKDTQMAKDDLRMNEIKQMLKCVGANGDLDKKAKRLLAVEKADPSLFKDLMDDQKKTAEMLKAAGIEIEVGGVGGGKVTESSAYKKLQTKADEILEKDSTGKITPMRALKLAAQKFPEIYEEYLETRQNTPVLETEGGD